VVASRVGDALEVERVALVESPLYQQGVTKGGFRACVYVGAGLAAGSATEMIFLGADMLRFFRILPRLSGIFVR